MINGALIGITAITPLRDRSGATIGLINMGLKFNLGEESEALKFATSVGQEPRARFLPNRRYLRVPKKWAKSIELDLAGEIPSKLALLERAQ